MAGTTSQLCLRICSAALWSLALFPVASGLQRSPGEAGAVPSKTYDFEAVWFAKIRKTDPYRLAPRDGGWRNFTDAGEPSARFGATGIALRRQRSGTSVTGDFPNLAGILGGGSVFGASASSGGYGGSVPYGCGEGKVGLSSSDVHLVVSTFDEDISWLALVDAPTFVYIHNRSSRPTHCYDHPSECPESDVQKGINSEVFLKSINNLRKHPIVFLDVPNVGDEAHAFLSHVMVYYERLPQAVVLLHGHRHAWHAVYDMPRHLLTSCFALEEGYRNLNNGSDFEDRSKCHGPDWEISPDSQYLHSLLLSNWNDSFARQLGHVPQRVCVDCCAQFVVSRDRLLRYPKQFYKRLRSLVFEGRTTLEREWRMMFVRPDEIGINDLEVDSRREALHNAAMMAAASTTAVDAPTLPH